MSVIQFLPNGRINVIVNSVNNSLRIGGLNFFYDKDDISIFYFVTKTDNKTFKVDFSVDEVFIGLISYPDAPTLAEALREFIFADSGAELPEILNRFISTSGVVVAPLETAEIETDAILEGTIETDGSELGTIQTDSIEPNYIGTVIRAQPGELNLFLVNNDSVLLENTFVLEDGKFIQFTVSTSQNGDNSVMLGDSQSPSRIAFNGTRTAIEIYNNLGGLVELPLPDFLSGFDTFIIEQSGGNYVLQMNENPPELPVPVISDITFDSIGSAGSPAFVFSGAFQQFNFDGVIFDFNETGNDPIISAPNPDYIGDVMRAVPGELEFIAINEDVITLGQTIQLNTGTHVIEVTGTKKAGVFCVLFANNNNLLIIQQANFIYTNGGVNFVFDLDTNIPDNTDFEIRIEIGSGNVEVFQDDSSLGSQAITLSQLSHTSIMRTTASTTNNGILKTWSHNGASFDFNETGNDPLVLTNYIGDVMRAVPGELLLHNDENIDLESGRIDMEQEGDFVEFDIIIHSFGGLNQLFASSSGLNNGQIGITNSGNALWRAYGSNLGAIGGIANLPTGEIITYRVEKTGNPFEVRFTTNDPTNGEQTTLQTAPGNNAIFGFDRLGHFTSQTLSQDFSILRANIKGVVFNFNETGNDPLISSSGGVTRWTEEINQVKFLAPQPPDFNLAVFVESDPLFGGAPSVSNTLPHAQYTTVGTIVGSQFTLVIVYHPNGNIDVSRIMSLRAETDATREISPTVNGLIFWQGNVLVGVAPTPDALTVRIITFNNGIVNDWINNVPNIVNGIHDNNEIGDSWSLFQSDNGAGTVRVVEGIAAQGVLSPSLVGEVTTQLLNKYS